MPAYYNKPMVGYLTVTNDPYDYAAQELARAIDREIMNELVKKYGGLFKNQMVSDTFETLKQIKLFVNDA